MQISYNWLKDYCKYDMPAQELADRLSHAGLCVETYEPRDGDWMLDVEVTSNRPDCLSHLGIAREIAALTATTASTPDIYLKKSAGDLGQSAIVKVECPELCPHYTARIIKDVKVGPSPAWMQQRLLTCGLRPVNNIVDITNYILLESGQPMHAFDLARLNENTVVVRSAEEGEKITAIDGTECNLSSDMCVIADAAGPVAVAGVMGGVESEITENTRTVLLESARFHPANVRRTSRKLGLSSDSSYRFERGVDPENVEPASRRGTELILELTGGELVDGLADIRADKMNETRVSMRTSRLKRVLGTEIGNDKVIAIFEGLGLTLTGSDSDKVTVLIPARRPDLTREIDLIEEVARIHGYDKITETTRIPVAIAPMSKTEVCRQRIKKMLAGQGFDEIITSSLVPSSPIQNEQPWHNGEPIPLRNPVSADKTHLRLTVMGNLIEAKRYNNSHKVPDVDIFESGKIYIPADEELQEQPEEKNCLALLTDRPNGFFVLKGVLENLLDVLHVPKSMLNQSPVQVGLFEEEKSLHFQLEDRFLGCLGELESKITEDMDFSTSPAIMELDLDLMLCYAAIEPELTQLPKYPAVNRDVAAIVDENVRWMEIERCVLDNAPEELEKIDFLDLYRGKQVPDRKKSIAFSLSFRSPERTLRSEEADQYRDGIVTALENEFGAQLRR